MANDGSVVIKIDGDDGPIKGKLSGIGGVAKGALGGLAKISAAAVVAAGTAVAALSKKAIAAYADYEQLIGGVETLFKSSASVVTEYAANAYKTAGLSANTYMETVTSFSASLLQSLDGDTAAAAKAADTAITDMADNANKMGSSMQSVQDAYQGFAKQNYTMLDNLKLGYGGTKTEMERLLADAEKLSGVKYDISSLNDVYEAIHVVQTELGITGTTALEASSTISGSAASMAAAWGNMLVGLVDESQDFDTLLENLVDSVATFAGNLVPRIETALGGIAKLVGRLAPRIAAELPALAAAIVPKATRAAMDLVQALANGIWSSRGMLLGAVQDVATSALSALGSIAPILSPITSAVTVVINNFESLIPVVGGAAAAFVAFQAALAIGKAVQSVSATMVVLNGHLVANRLALLASYGGLTAQQTVLGLLTGKIKLATVAQAAFNAVMSTAAGPIGLAVTAIAAVTGGILAYNAISGKGQTETERLGSRIKELNKTLDEQKAKQDELAGTRADSVSGVNAEIDATEGYISELRRITDENGRVKEGYEERARVLSEQINSVIPGAIAANADEAGSIYQISDAIDDLIFQKKKEMMISALAEEQQAAMENRLQSQKTYTEAIKAQQQAAEELAAAQEKAANAPVWSEAGQAELRTAQSNYNAATSAVNEAWTEVQHYQDVLNAFDAAVAANSMEELEAITRSLSGTIVQATGSNREELQQGLNDLTSTYSAMVSKVAAEWDNLSAAEREGWTKSLDSTRQALEDQAAEARAGGVEVPANYVDAITQGLAAGEPEVIAAIMGLHQNANAEGEAAAAESGAGEAYTSATAEGITAGESGVVEAATSPWQAVRDQGTATATEIAASIGAAHTSAEAAAIAAGGGEVAQAADGVVRGANAGAEAAAQGASAAGDTLVSRIAQAIQAKAGEAKAAAEQATQSAVDSGTQAAEGSDAVGTTLFTKLIESITAKIPAVKTTMSTGVLGAIAETISASTAAAAGASAIGSGMAEGVAAGVRSGKSLVISAMVSMVTTALAAAKAAAEINSPSRLFSRVIGTGIVEGVAVGVRKNARLAASAAIDLIKITGAAMTNQLSKLNAQIAKIEEDERARKAAKELADYEKALREKNEKLASAELKDRQKILDEIADLQNDWNEKQLKAQQDADKKLLQEQVNMLEDLQDEYDRGLKNIQDKQRSFAEDLAGFGDLFTVTTDSRGRDSMSLNDLDKDTEQILAFGDALQALEDKEIPADLLAQIANMGVEEGLSYANALLAKTDEDYEAYIDSWIRKQEAAAQVAKMFYESELTALQDEFVSQIPDELSGLKGELGDIGIYSGDALAEGLRISGQRAIKVAQDIASSIIATMRSALDIHSPSRKTRDLVGKPAGEGVFVGFEEALTAAMPDMRRIVDTETSRLSSDATARTSAQAAAQPRAEVQTIHKMERIENTPTINFGGDLAALATLLHPYIEVERQRIGGNLVKGGATT